MTAFIILGFIAISTIGALSFLSELIEIKENKSFTDNFRANFLKIVFPIESGKNFKIDVGNSNDIYVWLIKNVNKMQVMIGDIGIIEYVAPHGRYSVPNYHLVINTLEKYHEGLHRMEITGVDNCLLRFIGVLEGKIADKNKELGNPVTCFRKGFKEIISFPFYILNWFGLIPNKTVEDITSSLIVKLMAGIFALVGFLSGVVTIIQGWEETIEFINHLW